MTFGTGATGTTHTHHSSEQLCNRATVPRLPDTTMHLVATGRGPTRTEPSSESMPSCWNKIRFRVERLAEARRRARRSAARRARQPSGSRAGVTGVGVEEHSCRSARDGQVGASAAGDRERTATTSAAGAIVNGDLDGLAVDPKAALIRGHHAPPPRRSARPTRPRAPFRSYSGGPGGSPPARRGRVSALENRKPNGECSASTPRPLDPQRPYFGRHARTRRIAAACRDYVPVGERP